MAFQLKTDKKYTENKTIRFPLDLIQRIEENIKGKDVSFSSFVLLVRAFYGELLPFSSVY